MLYLFQKCSFKAEEGDEVAEPVVICPARKNKTHSSHSKAELHGLNLLGSVIVVSVKHPSLSLSLPFFFFFSCKDKLR